MMEALIRRGEEIADVAQRAKIEAVAAKLKSLFGEAAVEVQEAGVAVRGRGIIKRWLIDPSLRFLNGGLK